MYQICQFNGKNGLFPVQSFEQTQCNAHLNTQNIQKFGSFYALPSYYIKHGYSSNDIESQAILSFVTMCDINRLLSSKQIAINFNGPISIAIFIESIENEILNKIVCNKINDNFNNMNNKYDIYISLLYPSYSDKYYKSFHFDELNAPIYDRFPTNSLRNLAVSQINTKYVCMVDVDFIYMSYEINTINTINNSILHVFDDTKTIWIIPAFEWISSENELKHLKHNIYNTHTENTYLWTKYKLLQLIKSKQIQPFYMSRWAEAQKCTNYHKWYHSADNYMTYYCTFWYEPYMIFKTEFAKNKFKYDNDNIGRSADKVSHIALLAHSCFKFKVINTLFFIHEYAETHPTILTPNQNIFGQSMHLKYKKHFFNTYCYNNTCIANDMCKQIAKHESGLENEYNETQIQKFEQYYNSGRPKCLIILFGQIRAHKLTYKSFKKYLFDPTQCDLALMVGNDLNINIKTNPFYIIAKYIWIYGEHKYDYIYNITNDEIWDKSLQYMYSLLQNEYPNQFATNKAYIEAMKVMNKIFHSQHGSTKIQLFFRQYTYFKIKQLNLLHKYDYFLYIRSDYKFLCHFPFDKLTNNRTIKNRIWIANSEDWGGLNDRNLLTHKSLILNTLNILNDIFANYSLWHDEFNAISEKMQSNIQKTNYTKINIIKTYEKSKYNESDHIQWKLLNHETILKQHFIYNAIWDRVIRYDPVMFLVRGNNTFTRWNIGTWNQKQNLFIKHIEEYNHALTACNSSIDATILSSSDETDSIWYI